VLHELGFTIVTWDQRRDAMVHRKHLHVVASDADEESVKASRLRKIRAAIKRGDAIVLRQGDEDIAYEKDDGERFALRDFGTPKQRRERVERFPWEE